MSTGHRAAKVYDRLDRAMCSGVPLTTIRPPATTGLPYVCDPSRATHLTFRVVLMSVFHPPSVDLPTSNVAGRPLASETMFRSGRPPHSGQSFARAPLAARTNMQAQDRIIVERDGIMTEVSFLFGVCVYPYQY